MESFNDDVYTENGPCMILILPDILFVLKSTERKKQQIIVNKNYNNSFIKTTKYYVMVYILCTFKRNYMASNNVRMKRYSELKQGERWIFIWYVYLHTSCWVYVVFLSNLYIMCSFYTNDKVTLVYLICHQCICNIF